MAHFFYMPLLPPPDIQFRTNNPYRRNSVPLPPPPQTQAEMTASEFILSSSSKRSESVSSSEGSNSVTPAYDPAARRNSAMAAHRNPRIFNASNSNIRTRSYGYGPSVVFERDFSPPTDEDVIIVTVRLSNKFRKSSLSGAEELPSRPPARSFIRRLSTRMAPSWDHSAQREEKYKAIKMPRGEYRKHFARDREGNYAGSEPEREWDEEELLREYATYQDIPLHTILC